MMNKLFLATAFAGILTACGDGGSSSKNKFSDPAIRRIASLQDRRMSDSLYVYLSDENATYRKEAALAFASIQDSSALRQLGRMLHREQDSTVRTAIAFAIGQTPSQESERILLGALAKERSRSVLRELLEAYGKTTAHWQLVHPNFKSDTLVAEGVAWSIYRAGVRGKADSAANRHAAGLLSESYPVSVRLPAAHYFARGANDLDRYFDILKKVATGSADPDVRMAATLALRKIKTPESVDAVKAIFKNEKDSRVRVNAIRALQSFDYEVVRNDLYSAITDKDAHVAIAASEVIKSVATEEYWIEISNLVNRIKSWRVRANVYEAAMKASRSNLIAEEIRTAFNQSINPYEKGALLTALQHHMGSFDYVAEQMLKADTPVVRTSAAASLAQMNSDKDFTPGLKKKYVDLLDAVIATADPAAVGTFVSVFPDKKLNYKSQVDVTKLKAAREKMSLPRDLEAIQPLDAAIDYLEGREPRPVVNDYNNPIDWDLVSSLPREQKITVSTSRGSITMILFTEEAPGSVANFVRLARAGYFDKKPIHRVVPNFVIQTGCNRGDGSGGEAYSIRSEFSLCKYTTGSVGMASAGKDTEGTQWFITHSPTPHLDGRYTLFGAVTEGIDVVNHLQVGDRIEKAVVAE